MGTDDARPVKRRKLKPPGTSAGTAPTDDPSLHNGRIRAVPHVEGQWSTHVYLDIPLQKDLRDLLERLIEDARKLLPAETLVHSLIGLEPLHLSLSRPLQLYTSQRDGFRQAVTGAVRKQPPSTLSFAALANLTNDDNTRHFLSVEIGYGHAELLSLVRSIDAVLTEFKLPVYYEEARFHEKLESLEMTALRRFKLDVQTVKMKIGKDATQMPLLGA